MVVGRLLSYWEGLFSGAMLNYILPTTYYQNQNNSMASTMIMAEIAIYTFVFDHVSHEKTPSYFPKLVV